MNSQKVAKMQHKKVRIRPIARRIEPNGQELSQIDDWWMIENASRQKIKLLNPRSDHFVTLGTDHIREFLTDEAGGSDGFLVLKSQIILKGAGCHFEPLTTGDVAERYLAAKQGGKQT
jgi:hypothetical protein